MAIAFSAMDANCAGVMACAASHFDCAGSSCTSIMRPSAPAAAAASAMGSTYFACPVAWLGSTMTGRRLRSFMTATADRSSVLRVAV